MSIRYGLSSLVYVGLAFLLSLSCSSTFAQGPDNLTETFLSSDGLFSFKYPSGWVVSEQDGGMILLTDNEAMLATDNRENMLPDHTLIIILPLGKEFFANAEGNLSQSEILSRLTEDFSTDRATIDTPVEVRIGDYSAVQSFVSEPQVHSLFLVVSIGMDELIFASLSTAPGQIVDFEPVFTSVIETFSYQPGETIDGQVIWQKQNLTDEVGIYRDIAIDLDGSIYIANNKGEVIILSQQGDLQQIVKTTAGRGLRGLAIANNGTIWITDLQNNRVYQIDTTGDILMELNPNAPMVNPNADLLPIVVEIGPEDNILIYAVDSNQIFNTTAYVQVWSQEGIFIESFQIAEGDLLLLQSSRIVLGEDLILFISDNIDYLDMEGNQLKNNLIDDTITSRWLIPPDVALRDDGTILMTGSDSPILLFDRNGNLGGYFGRQQPRSKEEAPFEPGEFRSPIGIAVLPNGDVVVIDTNMTYSQVVRISFGGS